MKKTGSVVAILLLLLVFSPSAHAQVPRVIFYDAFMQQDIKDRLRTYRLISPGERASLAAMHLMRWIYVNRAVLTPQQRTVLDELLTFAATPDHHTLSLDPDATAKAKELMNRASEMFTHAEIRQALTIYADYIPPQPDDHARGW